MTAPDLSAIRAQLAGITPGPWHLDRDEPGEVPSVVAYAHNDGITIGTYVADTVENESDAAFIAAAPSTVERLLGIVDAQQAALQRVEGLAVEIAMHGSHSLLSKVIARNIHSAITGEGAA